jgi:O-antigen/teichoic acid export membrane protein
VSYHNENSRCFGKRLPLQEAPIASSRPLNDPTVTRLRTRTVQRNVVANFVSNGWAALTAVVAIPIYIKLLGVEAWGVIGIFVSLQTICVVLDFGLSTTLSREMARLSTQTDKTQEMHNLVRTLEYIYWSIGALIGISVIALAPFIASRWVQTHQLPPATIRDALTLMGVTLLLQWPFSLYFGGLMGLQRQVLLASINVGIATLRSVGAVLILWKVAPTLQAFFTWLVGIALLQTCLAAISFWRSLPKTDIVPSFQSKLLRDTWRFTAGVSGITVMSVILAQMDKVILSKLLSLEMFGYYILAGTVATSIYLLTLPVYSALYPRFTQLVSLGDEDALRELYHHGCQLMSALILPVSLTLAFFSREVIFLWTGTAATVEHTHLLLSILVIGTGLNGLMHLPYALQLAVGWTRLGFYSNAVAVLVGAPLMVLVASAYGAVGAAYVWVALNGCFILGVTQLMHRRLLKGEQWKWYVTDVGLPLGVSLVVAFLCRLLIPMEGSRVRQFIVLAAATLLVAGATGLATPFTRRALAAYLNLRSQRAR